MSADAKFDGEPVQVTGILEFLWKKLLKLMPGGPYEFC